MYPSSTSTKFNAYVLEGNSKNSFGYFGLVLLIFILPMNVRRVKSLSASVNIVNSWSAMKRI